MDFNRNLRIVRTSGSSYPFPYKNNVLWVHHDENNNPVSEIWDHGKWVPITGIGSGSGDVIIDTKMSDSSSNAIANKTVKKYVDGIASKTDASILSLNEGVSELKLLIDNLNSGYQFMGVATPETNPGTPDQKVFYIANGKDTYTNFGGIDVTEDEVVILYYDTAWHKVSTGIASQEKLSELERKTNILDNLNKFDSPEYVDVVTDAENKIIESTDLNGIKEFHAGVRMGGATILLKESSTMIDAVIDENGKFIEGIDAKGNKHIESLVAKGYSKNALYGRKWAVCGDSFSNGDGLGNFSDGLYTGKPKVYGYYIGNRNQMKIQHLAFGGRTIATPAKITSHNCFTDTSSVGNYTQIDSDADFITLYFGINDSHNAPNSVDGDGEILVGEIPIGDITDTTINTFCGAYNVALEYLIEHHPFAHIGVIVSNGCDNDEYRIKTIAIAKRWGIPYIDLNGDERTPMMLRSTNPDIVSTAKELRNQTQRVSASNFHPNEIAHEYESYFIENFLRTL